MKAHSNFYLKDRVTVRFRAEKEGSSRNGRADFDWPASKVGLTDHVKSRFPSEAITIKSAEWWFPRSVRKAS